MGEQGGIGGEWEERRMGKLQLGGKIIKLIPKNDSTRIVKITQIVNYLPYMHKDLSLISRINVRS